MPSMQKATEVLKFRTILAIIIAGGEHGQNWTATGTSVASARSAFNTCVHFASFCLQ